MLDKSTLLVNRLEAYASSWAYPFHMPGHKRRDEGFPDPFHIDITEIDGFDNLHHPEGILKESMEWAASVYGADHTWYLVNGSTAGILSAVCAATGVGGRILMGRNCHKSAYHGVILNQLKTAYIYPQIIPELGIQGGIIPEDVENLLEKYPDTAAVLIVSPTYDGIVSDVEAIAELVHRRGIPLLVDEAHGAHFPFGGQAGFPRSALDCGADLVIQSLHKTLPSLTQTAVLHGRDGYIDIGRLEWYLQMFQSSSPSYVLMASIERCIFQMEHYGKEWMESFGKKVIGLRNDLSKLRHLRLLGHDVTGQYGVFDVDMSKLVISVRGCVRRDGQGKKCLADGVWLADYLRQTYRLEMEMSGADYMTAILTCFDTDEGLARLKWALLEIDGFLESDSGGAYAGMGTDFQHRMWKYASPGVMTLGEAMEARWEELPLCQCTGRISAEFIYLYPPGIPIVAPGERITEAVTCQVSKYKRLGLPVQGMADSRAERLRVVKEQDKRWERFFI